MTLKSIPEIQWKNYRPPFDWWDFFKDADRHAFRFDAFDFDMLNAWWLVEASTLAYSDPDVARTSFARAGLPEVHFFTGKSTQCYVAGNDDFIIVAFRGTELRSRGNHAMAYDVLVDIQINLVPDEGGGRTHSGFRKAVDEIWQDREEEGKHITGLKTYLDQLSERRSRPIWFTGHSLGAAVATLAARRYGTARGLYTFASPRVGDTEFRDRFSLPCYRFANNNDIVCHFPPEGLYQHVGSLKFMDAAHRIRDVETKAPGCVLSAVFDEFLEMTAQMGKKNLFSLPGWMIQHVPVLYCVHIWNNYIRQQG
jgi:triacylglycerol lipase